MKSLYLLSVFLLLSPLALAKITPTDVFKEANGIKNCLATLVISLDDTNTMLPLIDIDVSGAKPKHVYSLTMALDAKVRHYLKMKNKSYNDSLPYPKGSITPGHVISLVQHIEKNIELQLSSSLN